uniref:Exportin-6 n=1 Tax=Heliothis virescens TaxID=7102 RepID=A0A2A4IS69_HELVI
MNLFSVVITIHCVHFSYLNKLAEFLKLFVSLHFKRLEAEPEFDAIEFLSYLFQFTFQVPTCGIFVNCLDIWIQFIDILKPEDTPKYWEALQALVNGVLNKIQFQHNKAQLQHLDNDVRDDDGETEWHTFLKHCIECIARVAELAPLDVFTAVLERWQCLAGVHARAASRGGEGERLLAALLDLATLTRVLGRLAPALLAGNTSVTQALVSHVLARHVLPRATVLIHRWRYFFPNKCEESESNARTDELRGALSALGRALLQPDIELLRLNIDTLDTLNTKCKLYHKVMFRTEFLGEFLSVLLLGLAEGGWRALARDEATAAVHAMALVDFAAFRAAFLPHFLASLPGLAPEHQQMLAQFPPDTDLPTFTQNIQRLMNDINCYRAYSSLAPVGMAS